MKKIISITSIVLLSTVAVFAGGTNESPNSTSGIAITKSEGSDIVKVYYKAEVKANVKITIFNASHQVVFFETIRKVDGFVRPYKLDGFEKGEYTIEITDGTQVQTQRLNTSATAASDKIVQVRRLRSDDGKFLLTASGKGEELIKVNIYDELTQKLLYSELQTVKDNFARVYNLSKVKGDVSFEVVHSSGNAEKINY